MTQSLKSKLSNPKLLMLALFCGLTTLVIAFGVQILLPDWPHARQGAIVGAWLVFCLSIAAFLGRRASQDAEHVAGRRRVP